MMTDHPLYTALLAILAVLYSVFIGWCIVDAVKRSVKPTEPPRIQIRDYHKLP